MDSTNEGPLEVRAAPGVEIQLTGTDVTNRPPPDPAEVMKRIEDIGSALRAIIIECKRLPRDKGVEAHQDPTRSLALAQAHLQTGFMWLRRSVENPKVF